MRGTVCLKCLVVVVLLATATLSCNDDKGDDTPPHPVETADDGDFVSEGKVWNCRHKIHTFKDGESVTNYYPYSYQVQGDTVIDNVRVRKVYVTDEHVHGDKNPRYFGAVHEAIIEGKVYIYRAGETSPALLYDWKAAPGTILDYHEQAIDLYGRGPQTMAVRFKVWPRNEEDVALGRRMMVLQNLQEVDGKTYDCAIIEWVYGIGCENDPFCPESWMNIQIAEAQKPSTPYFRYSDELVSCSEGGKVIFTHHDFPELNLTTDE